jgi:hypothetical protein
LDATIEQIALALGGAAGSRLARQLGILASGSTLLRELRRSIAISLRRIKPNERMMFLGE